MTKKDYEDLRALVKAIDSSKTVSTDLELKEAIKSGKLYFRSNNQKLYEKFLAKFSKDNIAKGTKKFGKGLMGAGVLFAGMTGGLSLLLTVPGALLTGTGALIEDYKNYSVSLDFEKREVIFIKVKGKPCLNPAIIQKIQKLPPEKRNKEISSVWNTFSESERRVYANLVNSGK